MPAIWTATSSLCRNAKQTSQGVQAHQGLVCPRRDLRRNAKQTSQGVQGTDRCPLVLSLRCRNAKQTSQGVQDRAPDQERPGARVATPNKRLRECRREDTFALPAPFPVATPNKRLRECRERLDLLPWGHPGSQRQTNVSGSAGGVRLTRPSFWRGVATPNKRLRECRDRVYANLHGQWHPTTNSGQDGNWKEHRAFLKALLKIKGRFEDE
jgi:hypothetical protein